MSFMNVQFMRVAVVIATLAFLPACEKKASTPATEPAKTDPIEPISVLNESSGFSAVHDDARSLSSAQAGFQPSLGISDFTADGNNNLHMVYYSTFPSQQDVLYTYYRRTKNLNSKQIVAQPTQADTMGSYRRTTKTVFERFRPYSNFFVTADYTPSSGFGYNNSAVFGGDLNANVSSPNPIGACDLGFRCPVMNSMAGFGYYFLDNNTPAYKMNCSTVTGAIGSQTNLQEYMANNVHEVYRGGASPEYFAFGLKKDSLKVFKLTPANSTHTVVASVKLTTQLTPGYGCALPLRHYSTDGNIISVLYKENVTDNIYTFAFNFTTNALTKNLDGVKAEYSGAGSDMDLDETGDIYYSGIAGNGNNSSGVSIYHKSGSASPQLVGKDNLLKFGTIIQLKVLYGKVFFVVSGKQTGKDVYQLTIIKQD